VHHEKVRASLRNLKHSIDSYCVNKTIKTPGRRILSGEKATVQALRNLNSICLLMVSNGLYNLLLSSTFELQAEFRRQIGNEEGRHKSLEDAAKVHMRTIGTHHLPTTMDINQL
jgi:hypothetical protein